MQNARYYGNLTTLSLAHIYTVLSNLVEREVEEEEEAKRKLPHFLFCNLQPSQRACVWEQRKEEEREERERVIDSFVPPYIKKEYRITAARKE